MCSLEKCKTFSFASSVMKNIVAFFFYISNKIIYYIAFGSASISCCLLKSTAISL